MSVENYEYLKRAESWYMVAAADRFEPALEKLKTLGDVFKWAHGAFAGNESKEVQPEKPPLLKDFIKQYGWDEAVTASAKAVVSRIPNQDVAYQFMLEEFDGASRGNEHFKAAALRSGISLVEYRGALARVTLEVDGPDGPQQLILLLSLQLADDQVMMARFRCEVGREIQEHFKLGCFAYRENEPD